MTHKPKLKPFLLRFKSSTGSTRKMSLERNVLNNFQYDPKLSQIVTVRAGRKVAVIHSASSITAPITKKEDAEDGDDRKDSWIWK